MQRGMNWLRRIYPGMKIDWSHIFWNRINVGRLLEYKGKTFG